MSEIEVLKPLKTWSHLLKGVASQANMKLFPSTFCITRGKDARPTTWIRKSR
jgi:hypothetical protein